MIRFILLNVFMKCFGADYLENSRVGIEGEGGGASMITTTPVTPTTRPATPTLVSENCTNAYLHTM